MRASWTATLTFPCCNKTADVKCDYRFSHSTQWEPEDEELTVDYPVDLEGDASCPRCGSKLTEEQVELLDRNVMAQMPVADEPELDEESPWYENPDQDLD